MIKTMVENAIRWFVDDLVIDTKNITIDLSRLDNEGKWHQSRIATIDGKSTAKIIGLPSEARILTVMIGPTVKFRINLGRR